MENKEALNTLHDIKNLMEKSTKFLSISGISSILVGLYACIGTSLAYFILEKQTFPDTFLHIPLLNVATSYQLTLICLIALGVLALSLLTAVTMSYRKAKKVSRNIFKDKSVYRLLWNFFLPLLTGGDSLFLFNMAPTLRVNLLDHAYILRLIPCQLLQVHVLGHSLPGIC